MNETIVKHLNFGKDARNKIFEGIEKLTKAVSSTLGASGKCVILEDNAGNPIITKDGVTVANSIILLDPVENMGAKLIKEAARKTVKEAGDGTTTATVLAHAILLEAYEAIKSENRRNIKEGINKGVEKVIKYLENIAKEITGNKITQVATISANNDIFLGKLISEAFLAVNETGLVTMENNDQPITEVEIVDGFEYDKGFSSPYFITDKEEGISELNNPYVLIVENKIENMRKLENALEHVIKAKKSLLIVGDVDLPVKQALAMNAMKGILKVNVIDAPIYGLSRNDVLEDLALLTGATVINEDLGDDMDLIQPEHFGTCIKSKSTATKTLIKVNELSNEVKKRAKKIEKLIAKAANENIRKRYEKRLSQLLAKVAIVKVGANSEVELKEKKDRVEDAICATRAAIKEGIVPGGGVALLNAAQYITPVSLGEKVLLNAIKSPYKVILENAGMEDVETPIVKGRGLDVVTGKTVSMVKSGIIDPLLVTKSALKNAASVATTILSTDCVINNLRAHEGNR
jgi:chaperonin GroEL